MSDQNVILITGAGSGLGRAIAEHLADKGDLVLGAMRGVKGKNAAIAAELATRGIRPIEIDVTSDASVADGVAAAMAEAGRIDVLINCAGIMPLGIAESFSVAQFEQTLQTNLIGPFRMMKAVLPHMRAVSSGLLINVTSIGGRMASPGSGIYAAGKWGLEGLAESIGYEVSKLGIDSVILEPSLYLTELKAKGTVPTDTANMAGYEALGDMANKVSSRFRPAVAASGVSTDPTTLAEYVHVLIRMPAGSRPIRTTVGFDTGTAELNAATGALQSRYMAFMGLSDMERVAPKD
jgi:NAD(P)-dependent dehydrogenase (short-subunit alcohol dehydrogenase family)